MIEDIFYKNIDKIDLHGYDMESARVATNDFIEESLILKRNKIIIIHGIGKGLVKKSVHETISKNKNVKTYKVDNFNPGMTIIELKIE